MRPIVTIAMKEIHENLISPRFLLLFLLAVALIPASLFTNYRSYLTRLAEERQIEERSREQVRQLKAAQIFTNPNFTIDVYWPPSATGVFASGFEESHPRHLVVGKRSVEFGAPLDVQPPSGIFGGIDYLFVVEFIFSLFAVLLSFDAITREKESGTLRSMLSNPLSRAQLAAGKAAGGYVTLAMPLVVGFLIGLTALAAAGLNVFEPDFLARAGWNLAGSLVYVAAFFLMGLFVSSITSSTYSALVISLAFWVVAVLVVPRSAALVAQLTKPVQSRQAAWLEKVAASAAVEKDRSRAVGGLASLKDIDAWNRERARVVAPFEERQAQAVKAIEDAYRRKRAEQRGLSLALSRISPAGALVSFMTAMSETGAAVEDRFLSGADRYREVLSRELFSKIYTEVLPGGGIRMGTSGPIDAAALPQFRWNRASVGESLLATDLAVLLAWFLAASAGIFAALARYDVR